MCARTPAPERLEDEMRLNQIGRAVAIVAVVAGTFAACGDDGVDDVVEDVVDTVDAARTAFAAPFPSAAVPPV